jgi:hypothetical protein
VASSDYLLKAVVDHVLPPHDQPSAAPRCVRYFVKVHGRQEFCQPSCGNRARAARFYHRQRADSGR